MLLLSAAEASQRVLTDHGRTVIGKLRALDMSLNAFRLIGCGRLNASGELRQITSLRTELGKDWGFFSSIGFDTEGLTGPQTPAQILEPSALVHVIGTFGENCRILLANPTKSLNSRSLVTHPSTCHGDFEHLRCPPYEYYRRPPSTRVMLEAFCWRRHNRT